MGKKKIIIAIVVLILVAFLIWNFFLGGSFALKYAELESIESKYGVSDEVLTPGSWDQLGLLEAELRAFRRSLDNSADDKALKLLVDSRLDLIAMEKKFLDAGQRIVGFNPFNPNCPAIAQTNEKFDEGIAKARSALEKRGAFLRNYPNQAATAGIESNEGFEGVINRIINSVELVKADIGSYC